jgi:hypothetical protein
VLPLMGKVGKLKNIMERLHILNQMAPLHRNYWEASFYGLIYTNAMVNNGVPYPVQERKAHHQRLFPTFHHRTCDSHEVLWTWTVQHLFGG